MSFSNSESTHSYTRLFTPDECKEKRGVSFNKKDIWLDQYDRYACLIGHKIWDWLVWIKKFTILGKLYNMISLFLKQNFPLAEQKMGCTILSNKSSSPAYFSSIHWHYAIDLNFFSTFFKNLIRCLYSFYAKSCYSLVFWKYPDTLKLIPIKVTISITLSPRLTGILLENFHG